MNASNFHELGDYAGFKREFMQLNGFEFDQLDYSQSVDMHNFINKSDTPVVLDLRIHRS